MASIDVTDDKSGSDAIMEGTTVSSSTSDKVLRITSNSGFQNRQRSHSSTSSTASSYDVHNKITLNGTSASRIKTLDSKLDALDSSTHTGPFFSMMEQISKSLGNQYEYDTSDKKPSSVNIQLSLKFRSTEAALMPIILLPKAPASTQEIVIKRLCSIVEMNPSNCRAFNDMRVASFLLCIVHKIPDDVQKYYLQLVSRLLLYDISEDDIHLL